MWSFTEEFDHTGLELPSGDQNLLLCETAQVAKSCLFLPLSESHSSGRGWSLSQWHRTLLLWLWLILKHVLEETLYAGPWAVSCCAKELPHLSFFRPSCQGTTGLLITDADIKTKQPLLCSHAPWLLEAFSVLKGTCPFPLFRLLKSLLQELFLSALGRRRQT